MGIWEYIGLAFALIIVLAIAYVALWEKVLEIRDDVEHLSKLLEDIDGTG